MKSLAHAARQWGAAGLALVCCWSAPAEAVVVSTSNLGVTASAPADNPYWNSVAYLGSASAVYLGNRWMITANHVGDGNVRFADGRAFDMAVGSSVRLTNSGVPAIGSPDLKMFRLAQDPGLSALEISTDTPTLGTNVMMIGAGRDRLAGLVGWSIAGAGSSSVWSVVPLPQADVLGYRLDDTKTMRWGTNWVAGEALISNNTAGFSTRFDHPGTPFEAQAASGDSGGGVFQFVDEAWQLAGIMATQQPLAGQPADAVVFSNQTQSADLSAYRAQILEILSRPDPPWQNQVNYFDVDLSGSVNPLDLILVINDLIVTGIHELDGTPAAGSPRLDVSGDGLVSPLDSARIINAMIGGTANPASAVTASAHFVPEPTSGVLALVGVLAAALGSRVYRSGRATFRRRRQPPRPARASGSREILSDRR